MRRSSLLRGIRTVRQSSLSVRYELDHAKWERLLDNLQDANDWIMQRMTRIELIATNEEMVICFPDEDLAFEFRMMWL